jgi:PAS domain S-box-containing protein
LKGVSVRKPSRCFQNLSPDRFEAVLHSISDGVFAVDQQWRISCFNRAAEEITGVPFKDAIGRPCYEVLRTNICHEACALRYTMETGRPIINLVVEITDAEGRRKPVSVSTGLFRNKKGSIVGGVETFRDLSVVEELRKRLQDKYTFSDIVSKSTKMQRIFDVLPTIARSDSTVLIEGESGTGKELVARALHQHSMRSEGPFISVNCGALPENLLESELFGYCVGAFTGANKDKPGRFALAEGGTLFLDELGNTSPALQLKLLRVLEERSYIPLGGVRSVNANVRLLTATNVDLKQLVKKGSFREDLYYRINVVGLRLPPLRERMEDVPLLVDHFISSLSRQQGKAVDGISENAIRMLLSYDYPGNVRELANIVEHAFVLCPTGLIEAEHLPDRVKVDVPSSIEAASNSLHELERRNIISALHRNKGNRAAAARELGIHKTTLFRKLHKLGISPQQSRERTAGAKSR